MTADSDRESSRLMKKHQIFVGPFTEDTLFPPTHKQIFEDIRELGNYRLSSYITTIDIRSKDEPWRRQTKSRVEWLSKRARTLKEQQRNEAGWRLSLLETENPFHIDPQIYPQSHPVSLHPSLKQVHLESWPAALEIHQTSVPSTASICFRL
jgi:hypothetical protein